MRNIIIVLVLSALALGSGVPAYPQAKVPVKLAQAVDVLAFAPLYVARSKGFFTEEGLDVEVQVMESGVIATQALVGGSVDMIVVAAPELVRGVAAGLDIIAVHFMSGMTQQFTFRKEYAERKGVTAKSPLSDRIAALKGANIGITRPGAASDTFARWILKKGGIDPVKDVNIVSIGGSGAQLAALKGGRTDAFLLSPPGGQKAEKEGYGVVLIPPADIPEFKNFWFIGLIVKRSYADKNPQVVAKAVRALAKANNFVLDNIEETKKIVRTFFPKVDPALVDASMDAIRPLIARDGKMSRELWENTIRLIEETGRLPKPLSPDEGVLWTNKYLEGKI